MRPFRIERPTELAQVVRLLASDPSAKPVAGGTTLVDLMKSGIEAPERLVDLARLPGMRSITVEGERLRIGALARMAEAAEHPEVVARLPAVSQSLLKAASPQLRNMASMAGNLLQRTRCGYFRDPAFEACNKRRPGSGCAALTGQNRGHAVLGGSDACIATHASDLAVALAAFDAQVAVAGPRGRRLVPVADLHLPAGESPSRETVLEPGELIVGIELPLTEVARRSAYEKLRDRASYEFALASVAAGLVVEAGTVRDARLALGGVATKPWRLQDVERWLVGRPARFETYAEAASRAVQGARGRGQNDFKIPMVAAAVRRTLERLGA